MKYKFLLLATLVLNLNIWSQTYTHGSEVIIETVNELVTHGPTTKVMVLEPVTNRILYLPFSDFGSGGGSQTLQQTYNNSTSPEIITDATRGALTIQGGTTIDNDNILEGRNNAGTITFSVNGTGNITSPSLDLKADKSNVLELDNTNVYTPTTDYHPATKKYVDDNAVAGTSIVSQTMNWRVDLSNVNNLYKSRHEAWAYVEQALFVDTAVTSFASLGAGVLPQSNPFMFAPWQAEIKSIRIRIGFVNASPTNLRVVVYCIDPSVSNATVNTNAFLLSESDEPLSGTTFQSIVINPTSVTIPQGYAIMPLIGLTGVGASQVNMTFSIELEKKN